MPNPHLHSLQHQALVRQRRSRAPLLPPSRGNSSTVLPQENRKQPRYNSTGLLVLRWTSQGSTKTTSSGPDSESFAIVDGIAVAAVLGRLHHKRLPYVEPKARAGAEDVQEVVYERLPR
jgi:hypothetical protein